MPDQIRQAADRGKSREVIIGIRPEHFEDAALVGDAPGSRVTVPVDLVESMGSDIYAYFTVRGQAAHSNDLEDLAKDTGQDMHGEGTQVVARLDAAANARPGKEAELWVDTSKMQVFDAQTGHNLTNEQAGAHAGA
jgi:multiple sugar transport system ATP-binding protein